MQYAVFLSSASGWGFLDVPVGLEQVRSQNTLDWLHAAWMLVSAVSLLKRMSLITRVYVLLLQCH